MIPKLRFLSDDRAARADTAAEKRHIEVICVGLSRCATSSLQAALEGPILGYGPCMHMAYVAPHVDRLELAIACLKEQNTEKRQKMLRTLFAGYAATADFPGVMFIEDLMDSRASAPPLTARRQELPLEEQASI